MFFPPPSGVPPQVCNVDRFVMENRQEQFAKRPCCTKSSSWQNVHLHFYCTRNCLGDKRFSVTDTLMAYWSFDDKSRLILMITKYRNCFIVFTTSTFLDENDGIGRSRKRPTSPFVYAHVTAPSSGRSNLDGNKGGTKRQTLTRENALCFLFPTDSERILLSPWRQKSTPHFNPHYDLSLT